MQCSVKTFLFDRLFSPDSRAQIQIQTKKIPKQKLFNVDLYSFSVTSPTTEVVPSIETIPKQDQDSPVIYPWMRKVHINNPG
jgi:hypothetical protein